MIGMLYVSVTPYYDRIRQANGFKNRPVLIIGGPRNSDYTVLPLSTISNSAMIDPEFDVRIEPEQYPSLHLNRVSYIRTHKQMTVHQAALVRQIADLRADCPELYLTILGKLEKFNDELMTAAL